MGVLLRVPVSTLDKCKAQSQPQSLRHIYQQRRIYQQQDQCPWHIVQLSRSPCLMLRILCKTTCDVFEDFHELEL